MEELSRAGSPAWRLMGLEVAASGEGGSEVVMAVREDFLNQAGTCHGGFIAMLADSAMGRAMHGVLPAGERHFSFDLKLNLVSPGRVGDSLRAFGKVLHAGRRTGVAECRVETQEGRLVATATASFIVMLPRKNP